MAVFIGFFNVFAACEALVDVKYCGLMWINWGVLLNYGES
jgi:hypothetical protein